MCLLYHFLTIFDGTVTNLLEVISSKSHINDSIFNYTSGAENNRVLLETIEKGNLGEKSKSKKCSRKVADDLIGEPKSEMLIKGPTTSCLSTDEQNKENNVTAEAKNSVSNLKISELLSPRIYRIWCLNNFKIL